MNKTVIVRLAVVCIACDIPAAWKICGFAGHMATLACSKCKHAFTNEKRSDFDTTEWEMRNLEQHRKMPVTILLLKLLNSKQKF